MLCFACGGLRAQGGKRVKTRLLSVPQFIALFVIVIGALTLARLADDAREVHALYQQVETLEQNKAAIEADIADLQSQLDASSQPGWIELMVRKWLHWTRSDETLIVVVSPPETSSAGAQPKPGTLMSSVTTHWQEWVDYLLGLNP
jgi:cell division protein FtsB